MKQTTLRWEEIVFKQITRASFLLEETQQQFFEIAVKERLEKEKAKLKERAKAFGRAFDGG